MRFILIYTFLIAFSKIDKIEPYKKQYKLYTD